LLISIQLDMLVASIVWDTRHLQLLVLTLCYVVNLVDEVPALATLTVGHGVCTDITHNVVVK
jgi:hypothetical protein